MSKLAKDPGLNEIAIKMKDIVWSEPLSLEEAEVLRSRAEAPVYEAGARRRHVYPLPGYKYWSVRIYLGGDQRTIGYATVEGLANALRFADMAAMHFWKYRVRGACPPSEDQLNRRVADVEEDMRQEEGAMTLLRQIESYLLETGTIMTAESRRALKQSERLKRHPSIQTNIRVNHLEVVERLDGICNTLAEIKETQKLIVTALQDIARMAAGKAVVTS